MNNIRWNTIYRLLYLKRFRLVVDLKNAKFVEYELFDGVFYTPLKYFFRNDFLDKYGIFTQVDKEINGFYIFRTI